ncbi:TetR/AcrR family transcriptional regulator [Microbacterium sp. NPDC077663]|uniref:TetR/AcrR family transcriptional regulator n=1 Tax=Microbacterium sp. NPDC077663 TaxID=3364189 RepID=UPI0037CA6E3B
MGSETAVSDIDKRTRIPYGEGRQILIEAVIRLVARDGLSRLTTRSLTAEAGVSQGSLQHHFPTMPDILGAALEHCVSITLSHVGRPTSIASVFDELEGAFRSYPEESAFQTEVFLEARRHPALLEVVTRHQEAYSDNLRTIIADLGLNPDEELVQLLMAFGDGIAYEYAMVGPAQLPRIEQQVSAMRRLLGAYVRDLDL